MQSHREGSQCGAFCFVFDDARGDDMSTHIHAPSRFNVFVVAQDGSIARTLDRSKLWEMQTPQVIRPGLLREGFAFVNERKLEVTDDVSIVEHLGHRVQITEGTPAQTHTYTV